MHTTSDARLVLLALLACAGAAALARKGDARFAAAHAVDEPVRATGAATGEGDRLRDGKPLDLNRASAAELELLPGVGPRLARDIVEARTKQGGFATLDALDRVRGIGPKKLAKLRPYLRLEQLEESARSQRDVGRVE